MARVRFLRMVLGRNPLWTENFAGVIRTILFETDSTTFLTRTSLIEHSGFFTDLLRRLTDKVIPPAPRTRELGYVIDLVFTEDRDPEWIQDLTGEDWSALTDLVLERGTEFTDPRVRLREELFESMLQLSIQISALGLHPEMRQRLVHSSTLDSPFVSLSRAALTITESNAREEFLKRIELCQLAVRHVHKSIEAKGVSLALLYRLETLTSLLRRLSELCLILDPTPIQPDADEALRALLVELLFAHRARSSVSGLLEMNFDLFAKKLVEHAGETGEHYIARSRQEYRHMYWAGAGGGLITVATTLFKFLIYAIHAPLGIEGLLVFFNYGSSFLTMQFLDFALATKQPSMTAAALAGRIQRVMPQTQRNEFVEEVVRITRSQLIAAVGNVSIVVIGCIVVSLVHQLLFRSPILDKAHALHTLKDFSPFASLTLWYAALTGVLLWLSSLGGGWLQNWVNMRGLSESVAHQRRLQTIFGPSRARVFGNWISRNAAGIGGNISIAFLLAFVPMIGKMSGLPIDIRHVTLSSGSATVAAMSLGPSSLPWTVWLPPVLGIVCMLILNFSVSFLLALIVATRSRRMPISWLRSILSDVGRRFRQSPLDFIRPSESET